MRATFAGLVACVCLVFAGQAGAVTPTSNELVANGTAVDGPCSDVDNQTSDELKAWYAETTDPSRVQASPNGGTDLTPTGLPYGLPGEIANPVINPNTLFEPSLQGTATGTPTGCQAFGYTSDTGVSGTTVKLYRPGPYEFEEHDFTTNYVLVADGSPDPTPTVCPQSDTHYSSAAGSPPPDPPNAHYALQSYCNVVTLIPFFVQGSTGGCPVTADMSQWPSVPYINQYDAGAALGLPVSAGAHGKAGGNACGPSSLLMGLLRQGQRDSARAGTNELVQPMPDLPTVFDKTMQKPRSQVADGDHNGFSGNPNAVAYLKSLGYSTAHTIALGTDMQSIAGANLTLIHDALTNGPALASTAFSTADWGTAGGGHIILLSGTNVDRPDEVAVYDPAGNYFSNPKSAYAPNGHYGPGSCGYGVLYPNAWLLAMTTGRWILPIGARKGVPTGAQQRPFADSASYATSTSSASSSAFALYDADPGGSDAPQSFYVQDPEGRRAGWIDGKTVSEIPNAAVSQDPPEWTDPAGGDPDLDGALPDPRPTPRSVVIPDPEAGTTVHVVPGVSGSYSLRGDAWADGSLTTSDALSGQGSQGQDLTPDSPALASLSPVPPASTSTDVVTTPTATPTPADTPVSAAAPPATAAPGPRLGVGKVTLRHGDLRVPLTCAGSSGQCTGTLTLTAKNGRRNVVLAHLRLTVAARVTKHVSIVLARVGRKLPRALRRESATLLIQSGGRQLLHKRIKL